MLFKPLKIPGVFLIEPEKKSDERGFFARSFCEKEFKAQGMDFVNSQSSISYNKKKGTLRGMHFQESPHAEKKLVRATRGKIFDVVVDLRPNSPSYKQWVAEELSAENHFSLYIPEGCAHGFVTLEEDTEILYQMGNFYEPGYANGVRWNDKAFGIRWPFAPIVISDADRNWPDYKI